MSETQKYTDPGEALHATLTDAIAISRVLANDRTIPGSSVVLEHKILVELIQLRRRVESHNAKRAAAKNQPAAAPAPVASNVAAQPAPVAPTGQVTTMGAVPAGAPATGSPVTSMGSVGMPPSSAPAPVPPSPLTPQNPNAPELNLDPAFQAELDRLRGKGG